MLPQRRLGIYLGSYLVYRFFTQFLRPEIRWLAGWTVYHWDFWVLLVLLILVEFRYVFLTVAQSPNNCQAPISRYDGRFSFDL